MAPPPSSGKPPSASTSPKTSTRAPTTSKSKSPTFGPTASSATRTKNSPKTNASPGPASTSTNPTPHSSPRASSGPSPSFPPPASKSHPNNPFKSQSWPDASPFAIVIPVHADVAQWQSNGFVNRRLRVRLPPSAFPPQKKSDLPSKTFNLILAPKSCTDLSLKTPAFSFPLQKRVTSFLPAHTLSPRLRPIFFPCSPAALFPIQIPTTLYGTPQSLKKICISKKCI